MREAVDTLCRGGPLPVGMAEIYKISAHAAAMVSCVAPSGAFVPDLGEAVRSRTVAVSVAILSGLMLSGCSGDSNWGDKDSDSPSPARKGLAALEKPAEGPTPDGVQDNTTKDSKTLATEAVAVMADAPALKVAAAGTGEDGQAIRTEGCVRTTDKALRVVSEQSGGVFEVIHFDGYQYMQGDTRAWLALTGLHSAEAKAVFDKTLAGNRWVKSKLSSDDVWSLPLAGVADAVTKGEPTTFNGKQAVPLLRTKADGEVVTNYVAARGTPIVLGSLTSKPGTPFKVETIVDRSDACDVSAPAPTRTVGAEELDKQLEAVQE